MINLPENTLTAVSGTIGNNAYGNKDVDMYVFAAKAGDFITIGGQNSSPYPYMRLFDLSGNQLAIGSYSNNPSIFRYAITTNGTYYLGISAAYSNTTYNPNVANSVRQRLLQRGVPDHAQPVVGGRHHRDWRWRRHAGACSRSPCRSTP